ncbi:MAG: 16S rRNA (uracil(1498)-N(3))-methyltransferase [Candidatus Sumerlaeaceae bacterium]|nr:16S rRNA (uracil(1498)-N(3))-methyltransferase [Candidatus Sumerlaeaceae bacterium]
MSDRFHTDEADLAAGRRIILPGDESHHLIRVCRARPGHRLRVFGNGLEFEAVLVSGGASDAEVELGAALPTVPPPAIPLDFCIPWIKGGRTEFLVQKLTELGVRRLRIFHAAREVVKADDGKVERLRRVALEAAKQCGRADLPELGAVPSLAAAMEASTDSEAKFLLYEEERTRRLGVAVSERLQGVPPVGICVASGPEGGFDRGEVESVASKAEVVSLGGRILRAETAPIAAAAVILAAAGEM